MRSHFVAALLLCLLPALGSAESKSERRYLSGRGKDDAVPWRFLCTAGARSGYWTNLPVPSNWELHGFGTLSYQRDPTNAPVEEGRYEHEFKVPRSWAERRVFLVFDGVMTDTHAEVNGQSAGPDHEGGFYQFRYEVTKLLKFGAANRLSVLVRKRSQNASVNRAERQGDYWLFGGIFRPVYLEAVPQSFIQRVAIDARADGSFAMQTFVEGASAGDRVEARIVELNGRPQRKTIQGALTPALSHRMGEGASHVATLRTAIPSPRLWTAETPNLYVVEVSLKRGNQLLHTIRQRFGFRTMEVRDSDGLYVNGRRVILKGANRHSFWPDSGRCLSEAVHRLDIGLMKEMNMNAVRMSHYPPDEQFLDLCDELGLYVLDELGGWQNSYDTPTGRRLIGQMVRRDVNHPSILFWDNGNEGGWNHEVDEEFAKWDPQQRRVLHPWSTFNGVNTAHYLTYSRMQAALAGQATYRTGHGRDAEIQTNRPPFVHLPTEFLHGLYDGGAGAGLEDYWETMLASRYFGGAFIWALIDEGVKRPDTGTIDVHQNYAPDGIVGPYRQKEASFYTVKELWSPIAVRLEYSEENQVRLSVENRYSFVDASACRFRWRLLKFPGPNGGSTRPEVLASGEDKLPAIAPGSQGKLVLELPPKLARADAIEFRVDDPGGRMLWTWRWPGPAGTEAKAADVSLVEFVERPDVIELKARDVSLRINRATGLLAGVRAGRREFSFANGPRSAAGEAKLKELRWGAPVWEESSWDVTATYEGDLKWVSWKILPDGIVQCAYTYTATGPKDFHGVLFDYPETLVKAKRWHGDGPYRVWQNRRRGVTLGVWENAYNNTITGWSGWEYPEFKGCFANVRWLQLQTTEGSITAMFPETQPYVQVLTPEAPPEPLQRRTAVSLPKAGLGLLPAIPGIGNKFHASADTGHQGAPSQANGDYSGTVYFRFGK